MLHKTLTSLVFNTLASRKPKNQLRPQTPPILTYMMGGRADRFDHVMSSHSDAH